MANLVSEVSAADTAAQLLFLIGLMIGLRLTVLSRWRSRAVPRPAALLLLAFLIVDLAGRRVESHLLGLAGASWIAIVVLRAPRSGPSERLSRGDSLSGQTVAVGEHDDLDPVT